MGKADAEATLIRWLGSLAEQSKSECFGATHIATCPAGLDAATYIKWAADSAFTAKMALEYAESDEDINRAEFWDAVCRFLARRAGKPADSVPDPVTEEQYREYLETIANNLTGPEQTTLRNQSPNAYEVWFDLQFKAIPMPGYQKPDINGFREGDRVALIRPFRGDSLAYAAGANGTVIITDNSPAQIRLGRSVGLHEILMDNRAIIGVETADIRRVRGRMSIVYSADGQSVGVGPFGRLAIS